MREAKKRICERLSLVPAPADVNSSKHFPRFFPSALSAAAPFDDSSFSGVVTMPRLHWRDQEKEDRRRAQLARKKSFGAPPTPTKYAVAATAGDPRTEQEWRRAGKAGTVSSAYETDDTVRFGMTTDVEGSNSPTNAASPPPPPPQQQPRPQNNNDEDRSPPPPAAPGVAGAPLPGNPGGEPDPGDSDSDFSSSDGPATSSDEEEANNHNDNNNNLDGGVRDEDGPRSKEKNGSNGLRHSAKARQRRRRRRRRKLRMEPGAGPESATAATSDHDDQCSVHSAGSSLGYFDESRASVDELLAAQQRRSRTDGNDAATADVVAAWQQARAAARVERARRVCNNCDRNPAAWRCHGCDYNYCVACNKTTHHALCKRFRRDDHVLERIDGLPLHCGRCRRGVWDIAAEGYVSFGRQAAKKKREALRMRMREEMVQVREDVEKVRQEMKKARKGHRLRQAQQEKLQEMLATKKAEVQARVGEEIRKRFAPMCEPCEFAPEQLVLARSEDTGRPLLPPPRDPETGRSVAMFSLDFERNSVLCRPCTIFWNSGPKTGRRRVVLNAYAAVGPRYDPQAEARRTVQRIHDDKVHAALLARLQAEAEAAAKAWKPPKKKMCTIL